jgi:DNA polymerase-3 subunit gamma/tau
MLLPSAAATDAAVLQRLEGLERRMTTAPAAPSAPAPAQVPVEQPAEQPQRTYQRPAQRVEQPPPAPEPEPAAVAPSPGGMDSTKIRQVWPELLKKVSERSKPTLVLLQNATVKAVEGNTLVLAMPTPGLAKQLSQDSRADVIKATLRELFNGDWQVQCVHGDSAAPPAAENRRPATATRTRPVAEARIAEPPPAPPKAPPPAAQRRAAPPADVPPPPEPPDDDEPPPDPRDEDVTVAAQAVPVPAPVRRDPDAVAVDLLTEQLRARRIH